MSDRPFSTSESGVPAHPSPGGDDSQQVAQIGNWEFEIATQKNIWSAQVFRLYGCDPALPAPSFEQLLQKFVPADRERLASAVERAIATGALKRTQLLESNSLEDVIGNQQLCNR